MLVNLEFSKLEICLLPISEVCSDRATLFKQPTQYGKVYIGFLLLFFAKITSLCSPTFMLPFFSFIIC